MGVKATEFAASVDKAYTEKWGYIWGQSGDTWTETKQKSLEKKYNKDPEKYADYAGSVKYGSKWIGKKVADCSGLPYGVLARMGIRIHHGSNTIWRNDLVKKGRITKGMKLPVGAAILTGTENSHPHIGTLVTSTCVCEAKGPQSGVVHTPLSNKKWTYWGLYKGVDYDFIPGEEKKDEIPDSTILPVPTELKTLRKGAKGEEVRFMQEKLLAAGEKLPKYGADGDFGAETLKAVKSFQKKNGLVTDGICGPKTWAKLV